MKREDDINSGEPAALAFYTDVLKRLNSVEMPFLIGGGFAYARYSGIDRMKKDLDIFVRHDDAPRVLEELGRAGYRTELAFPHWLGKIHDDGRTIDVIFSSGNGIARVDEAWFRHSVADRVLGVPVRLCPPEEMIWSKAFVQERERFDGGDVLHLIRALGPRLDWPRILMRFDRHWRVLLSSVVLFGYAYPAEMDCVPRWVTGELLRRFNTERADRSVHMCQGTLLSRSQYQWDIHRLGYVDARAEPAGSLSEADIAIWDGAADDSLTDESGRD